MTQSLKELRLSKKAFIHQYYGQNVLVRKDRNKPSLVGFGYMAPIIFHTCYLELKSLDNLHIDDAIAIAKIIIMTTYEKQVPDFKTVIKEFLNSYDKRRYSFDITVQVIDYLRSKGYAVPWNGYSIDEQIKLNWIKLL